MKRQINEYLLYLKIERKLSDNTISAYENDLLKFNSYIKNKSYKLVEKTDITNYIKFINKTDKSKTIARNVVSIRTFFKYLYREKKITNNPCDKISNPKVEKSLPNVLNFEDVDKLLNIKLETPNDYRNISMIELMYATGIRVSELVNLEINNINFDESFIRCFGKGKKERIIPIGDYAVESLKRYIEIYRPMLLKENITNKVFISNYKRGITRQGFYITLKKIAKENNINKDISPHTLRHTFATHLLEYGADLKAIGDMLGHENIKTTQIYTKISNNKKRKDYDLYHPRNKNR